MGWKRKVYRFWRESQKDKDHQENLVVWGTLTLRWILQKEDGLVWTGFIWLRIGIYGGLL
jgi:hypothetical protein